MHSSWFLTALIVWPLLGALVVRQRRQGSRAYSLAVVTVLLELALAVTVALVYNGHLSGDGAWDFFGRWSVSAPLGLAYSVAADGLTVGLVVMTAVVFAGAIIGARESRRESHYLAWQLALLSLTMGAFVAHDVLDFFIFFELVLVPSYFLLVGWGLAQSRRAAMKFFLYTFTGSAPALVAIIFLGFAHQHQQGGALSFGYEALSSVTMSASTAVWLFVAFAIAFAVKAPLWPLHSWSPPAYGQAPSAAAAELAGALSKLGTYGLLRFAVGLLPLAFHDVQPYMLTLAVVAILWGSLVATTSRDLRRLAAFSSVAQMGFIVLGIMAGSSLATTGSVILMVNHGVITMGVFLLIGYLEERKGSASLHDVRGLQGNYPVLAGFVMLFALATMGLPGLSGFVGEFLIMLGTFSVHAWWALAATLGVVGAAAYWLWAYQRAFHGPTLAREGSLDVGRRELNVLVPTALLVVVLGIAPAPLLSRVAPSVSSVLSHVITTGATQ